MGNPGSAIKKGAEALEVNKKVILGANKSVVKELFSKIFCPDIIFQLCERMQDLTNLQGDRKHVGDNEVPVDRLPAGIYRELDNMFL